MRKSALLAGVLGLAVAGVARADEDAVFGPGPGGAIPDFAVTPGTFSSTIVVPAGTPPVISLNNVTINMGTLPPSGPTGAHSWVGDLVATLTAPNGDNAQILVRTGSTSPTGFGSSSDFGGGPFVFVNSGGASFATAALATPVPAGTYNRFNNPLVAPSPPTDADDYSVFAGDPAAGVWTLRMEDWAGGDTGGLASWTMDITIPEPGSLGLLVAGIGLPLLRRRRH